MKGLNLITDGIAQIMNKLYPYENVEDSEYGIMLKETALDRIMLTGFIIAGVGYTVMLSYFQGAPTYIALTFLTLLFHQKEYMLEEIEEMCIELGVYEK